MNENKNALVLVEQGCTYQMMSGVTGTCFGLRLNLSFLIVGLDTADCFLFAKNGMSVHVE